MASSPCASLPPTISLSWCGPAIPTESQASPTSRVPGRPTAGSRPTLLFRRRVFERRATPRPECGRSVQLGLLGASGGPPATLAADGLAAIARGELGLLGFKHPGGGGRARCGRGAHCDRSAGRLRALPDRRSDGARVRAERQGGRRDRGLMAMARGPKSGCRQKHKRRLNVLYASQFTCKAPWSGRPPPTASG
jgi:hypothetical protein